MARRCLCLWFVILFAGCAARSQFALTGAARTPLPDTAAVAVVPYGDTGAYDTIGTVEVRSSSADKRLAEAKRVARANGGDVIMPRGGEEKHPSIQTFLVLKSRPAQPLDTGKDIAIKDRKGSDVDGGDFGKLPRATYKMLVHDYRDLKDEKFRGSLYPVRFVKRPPRALRRHGGEDDAVLLMSTKSGRSRLYVIVPEEKVDDIKESIKERARINFIYTPVSLHTERGKRYPVLRLIDTK
ncbi:MAG TPA: hypothetical protein PKJ16_02180 [Spirochaetota bacterium]|nr:hypothetical protein [Spirochaetota bacterium]HOS38426.1 hypothetical protein [Spirochaetota bacterium]HPU90507.1 hypothetical protein [Spirochaetota bacterium]